MSDLGDSSAIESSLTIASWYSAISDAVNLYLMEELLRRGQEMASKLPEYITAIAEKAFHFTEQLDRCFEYDESFTSNGFSWT